MAPPATRDSLGRTWGESRARSGVNILRSKTNQSALPVPKPRAYTTSAPTSGPTQPRACTTLVRKSTVGRKVGLVSAASASSTPSSVGEAALRVRAWASWRAWAATSRAGVRRYRSPHPTSTTIPPPCTASKPPSMVLHGALKGRDEGGRRPARDARRDAIHRGGPEGHGDARPRLARQRLPENRDGNRPRRYCQDKPEPQTDEPSGHHGASPLTPCIPDFPGRSYWLPGSEAPTVSEKRDAFVRLST